MTAIQLRYAILLGHAAYGIRLVGSKSEAPSYGYRVDLRLLISTPGSESLNLQ
jgi:hypothetical protein